MPPSVEGILFPPEDPSAVDIETSQQGYQIDYRVIVDRRLRSEAGDVLQINQADFKGFW